MQAQWTASEDTCHQTSLSASLEKKVYPITSQLPGHSATNYSLPRLEMSEEESPGTLAVSLPSPHPSRTRPASVSAVQLDQRMLDIAGVTACVREAKASEEGTAGNQAPAGGTTADLSTASGSDTGATHREEG